MARNQYRYIIKRTKGVWQIVPDRKNPRQRPLPGSVLKWAFERGETGATAHFQFCNFVVSPVPSVSRQSRKRKRYKYNEECFLSSTQINADWVASIPGGGKSILTATLLHVPPQKIFYAVWVVKNGKGAFAIGHNPPPDIQTGP